MHFNSRCVLILCPFFTVCEKVRENEAVKMIRLKEGLTKISEAYMMMGKKCSILFEAERVKEHKIYIPYMYTFKKKLAYDFFSFFFF